MAKRIKIASKHIKISITFAQNVCKTVVNHPKNALKIPFFLQKSVKSVAFFHFSSHEQQATGHDLTTYKINTYVIFSFASCETVTVHRFYSKSLFYVVIFEMKTKDLCTDYLTAITAISTHAFFGKAFTATAARAG